jgi:hypothetical protein
MDWHSDQMNANGLLRDRQSLMQQNRRARAKHQLGAERRKR